MSSSPGGAGSPVHGRFPGPVTFKEDVPRKGFFSLHLGIKEMKVNKTLFGLGKSTPRNAEINPKIASDSVYAKVVIQGDDGNPIIYEYKKPMPEDIDPDRCSYKVKEGRLILIIAKKTEVSWDQHGTFLCKPN